MVIRGAKPMAISAKPAPASNPKPFTSLYSLPDHSNPEKRFKAYDGGRTKNEVAPSLPIKIPPSVTDKLVYIHESLNYCDGDRKRLIPSTTGRRCSKDSAKGDSCDVLCCGRGYNTQVSVRNRFSALKDHK